MSEQDRARATAGAAGEGLAPGEQEQLVYALEARFAAHRDAAAAAVREAERELTEAQDRLARAEEAAASERYTSTPLPFMRQTLDEEVDGLERKTTPKKVRAAYRFLLDRAAELAAAEVQGFQQDQADLARDRADGVAACREAVDRATATLAATREMASRVRAAEQAARRGLDLMVAKLSAAD
ncbi:hypothetical protein [Ornithinimicrobium sufpigmenti]|uniref:hypothetical protein n=1 Tax=Ornithinimicrobium sufpigmenti TaxID=2508882 RepID=UPI001035C3C0|nr:MULTISPECIES: hypothetical protein [unclassified Ornithinimicrobium]